MSELQSKTTAGLKWSAIERLATQAIQLIIMLVLARMLGPHAFGLIGMLAVFIAVCQVFVDSGFSSALIRKTDRTESDFSTAFYFNIAVSLVCYAALFISAPYIADFYQQPTLIDLTRVLGITVFVNSLSLVQRAKLTIEMDFKTQAKASLVSVGISSCVAILLATNGYGVWALVAQTLSMAMCNAIILNVIHPWLPRQSFSMESFKNLFGFGSKLLLSGLLDTVFKNIYQIVIGKQFSAVEVGQFTQANQLSSMPAMTMTTIIQRVTYPMMSQLQHSDHKLEAAYLLTLRLSAVVIFPLMFGLAVIAQPLINVVLGDSWQQAAALVSILSVGFLLYPIHAINLNLLQVKGRSDLFLKLEIIKKIIITIILVITIPLGIKAICIGMIIQSYLSLWLNTFYTGRLTALSQMKQCKALMPIWSLSAMCCLLGWWVANQINSNYDIITIITAVTTAIISYVVSIRLLQQDLYQYIISVIFRKKLA
ncbi:lipopolysaccharide biosynthesis protein [Vibrio diabolicus]|uniref:lipopolysaccharide biosynthesis protein n=1 Tax=Vibrio diabolicus TaxID=50719 RepID=UPI00211B7155|nr:lipopolysaccharide biosynthesis protein [Vibrio diabolicus]MCG6223066.1 lipopolysaccharide biosynthesis protein [Vibrio diabolicus]